MRKYTNKYLRPKTKRGLKFRRPGCPEPNCEYCAMGRQHGDRTREYSAREMVRELGSGDDSSPPESPD